MNRNPLPAPTSPSTGSASSKRSRGSIICTASNAGLYPFPISPLYAASKAGVIALVRSAARVLARGDIQINALAPATLAPSKELFRSMTITPMEVLLRGVDMFLADPKLTGQVAEIHGNGTGADGGGSGVTIRPHHEFVDEASERNIEAFWDLGYA
ncbi:hypothetical protein N0V85_006957 [Neurospora sp. IMI 360204]|nr:hypothetical protein N0V85_006957 [Neurospora sp. IMI 360204]